MTLRHLPLRPIFVSLAPLLLSFAGLIGCASSDGATPDDADSELATKGPKLGASDVALPPNRSAAAVAVVDQKLFVGLHDNQLAIVDASTMKVVDVLKTYDLGGKTGLAVRADEAVVRDGKSLVLLGYDNTGPNGARFAFVLTWLDPSAKKITKEVRIELDKNIMSADDHVVQRPQGAVAVADGTVHFAIHQLNGLQKLVSFPVPSAERTVLNQDGKLLERGVDVATSGKGLAISPDGKSALMGVPQSSKDGYLERIDLSSGKRTKLGEKLGYPKGVVFAGGKLYVGDYNGALLTLDPATGKVLAREEVDDFLAAIALDDKYVYLVTDHQFVVKPIGG